MLQWEIEGQIRWLCRECTRENTPVFLVSKATLLGEEENSNQRCYCCRCSDTAADRFRGWRWLYYGLCCMFGLPSPARAKTLRRSK